MLEMKTCKTITWWSSCVQTVQKGYQKQLRTPEIMSEANVLLTSTTPGLFLDGFGAKTRGNNKPEQSAENQSNIDI